MKIFFVLICIWLCCNHRGVAQQAMFFEKNHLSLDSKFDYQKFSFYPLWSIKDSANSLNAFNAKDRMMKNFFYPIHQKYERELLVEFRDAKWMPHSTCSCLYDTSERTLSIQMETRSFNYMGVILSIDSLDSISSMVKVFTDLPNSKENGVFISDDTYLSINQATYKNIHLENRISTINRIITGYAYIPYSQDISYAVMFRCFVEFKGEEWDFRPKKQK